MLPENGKVSRTSEIFPQAGWRDAPSLRGAAAAASYRPREVGGDEPYGQGRPRQRPPRAAVSTLDGYLSSELDTCG